MAVLIVTYDLNKEPSSKEYQGVLNAIKSGKNWARLSESSYAVDTAFTPEKLYLQIKPYLDKNDFCLIFTANKPYFGQHTQEVIDWCSGKLR